MHHIPCAVVFTLGLAAGACGDDEAEPRDTRDAAGETSPDTPSDVASDGDDPDTAGPDTAEDTAAPDAAPDVADTDTSEPACVPGDRVEVVAGDEAVTLALCGATLVATAPAGTTVSLALVEAPTPLPFEHALVGHAYEVAGEGTYGTLAIADDGEPPGYRMAALYEAGEWLGFEACPTEGGIDFLVGVGTYALFRDTNTYPESPYGVGGGTITSTFIDTKIVWDFSEGYAIHDVDPVGLRNVTLIARRTPSEGVLQQLDVRLVEQPDHTFAELQVTLLDTSDTSGGWSWVEPAHGPLVTSAVASDSATGPVTGTFEAPLHKGEAIEVMTVELDVTTGRYRFPPEGACFPEG